MDRVKKDSPLSSPNLLEIRDYWTALKKDREIPARGDFSPASIARHLPIVSLTDVFYNPLRFRYRLLGTRITELAGRNATGKWLDEELYGEKTDDMLWSFRQCVEVKHPIAVREQVQFVDKSWVIVEVALFPLCDEEGRINVILSALDTASLNTETPPDGTCFILDWEKS
ncbi:PAS domain-containing protein [Sneathiella chungangensis]|uniref:PAS domain-containing protein n=1 Tax=Sneathiella chungangensis TaxID=1418234 RepID=A0A845MJ45_9PROT|nr:PAS domain-containing protein [Sneathiella chungangensis]MZR23440.1 PAS domain-containing protein [Sneathiella chungangensis]